jgi:hypothetical protein
MTTSLSTLSRELAAEGVALSLEREGELLAQFTQSLSLSRERDLILFLGRDALYDDLSQYSRESTLVAKVAEESSSRERE